MGGVIFFSLFPLLLLFFYLSFSLTCLISLCFSFLSSDEEHGKVWHFGSGFGGLGVMGWTGWGVMGQGRTGLAMATARCITSGMQLGRVFYKS
ncbi:uncharacterized protein P884DRAFT_253548 [Thermothelomyces heterothallicus CBS 202.75]|uniref:uncharacterized protein n=1 Tax=Thermothelomyces heterothallicus CBS 202.75 TaxID=1149848 RepID=UPI003742AD1F